MNDSYTVMAFTSQALLQSLQQLPACGRYLIAYSGGADSHVLLYAMSQLAAVIDTEIVAVHVDHQLQAESGQWAQHCVDTCAELGIACQRITVKVARDTGKGLEAAARQARYQALTTLMRPGDGLLTAHHQDDQAETLLIQLLRGSGPKGLAAMAVVSEFGDGLLLRPLLEYSREALQAYARAIGIQWVEDPSNRDERFDRNYLRHQVMPGLQQRWPSMAKTLGRAARHQAEAGRLMAELAELDMQGHLQEGTLSSQALDGLTPIRQKNLLRQWIENEGYPLPSEKRLQAILSDLLPAAGDAMPRICWAGVELRRFQQVLYLMPQLSPHEQGEVMPWNGEPMVLAGGVIELQSNPVASHGLPVGLFSAHRVEVRFRQGGEQCRPAGRGNSKDLKKLFQEAGLPPWLRERLPLIYVDGQLAAVAGICVCEGFAAREGEAGREVVWKWRKKSPDSEK